MPQPIEFRPTNPKRSPDWRWRLAGYYLDEDVNPSRRTDKLVRDIVRFRRGLDEAEAQDSDALRWEVYGRHLALFEAYQIYDDDAGAGSGDDDDDEFGMMNFVTDTRTQSSNTLRWELEARLLSGQDKKDIAEKLGTEESVVDVYERVFFNVEDRLKSDAYIAHTVIGSDAVKNLSSGKVEQIWKLWAWRMGPAVVDWLVYRVEKGSMTEDPSILRDELVEDARRNIKMRGQIATHLMPLGGMENQHHTIDTMLKALDLEIKASNAGSNEIQDERARGLQAALAEAMWDENNRPPVAPNVAFTQAAATKEKAQDA